MHSQGFALYILQNITKTTISFGDTMQTTTIDTTVAYIRDTGSELQSYDDTSTTDYDLVLDLPLTVGNTWAPYPDSSEITREVLSLTETVSVSACTFSNCAYMRDTSTQSPGVYIDSYFCRGKGMVKNDLYVPGQGTVMYMEFDLASYTVN